MTVDEALIEISQMCEEQHIEPIGATTYDLMRRTGQSLSNVLAELRAMRSDGIVNTKLDLQGNTFWCFKNPAYYQETAAEQPQSTAESATTKLEKLEARQKALLSQLKKCVETGNTAEYQRIAREYSEIEYQIEVEQVLKDSSAANKSGKLDRAKRTVAVPHNYEKRGLSK